MKNIVFILFLFMALTSLSCSKEDTSPIKSENPPDGLVTFVSSAKPSGGSMHIARTTSDGKTSEITYLTNSPYNDYKPVISPDGNRIAFFRSYKTL